MRCRQVGTRKEGAIPTAKIEIERERCKGCGYCVMNCPKHIIRISGVTNSSGYAVAEQTEEEKCTGCKLCAIICPDMAISVYR